MTNLNVSNNSPHQVVLEGITGPCSILCPPASEFVEVLGREESRRSWVIVGTPGRFFQVDSEDVDVLSANLNVRDTSRAMEHAGTEIPIVPVEEFRRVIMLEMPVALGTEDRLMLRVYSSEETDVEVSVQYAARPVFPPVSRLEGFAARTTRSTTDPYEPAYWQMPVEPFDAENPNLPVVRIQIRSTDQDQPAEPVWGFLSITNNATQLITTVTPQL